MGAKRATVESARSDCDIAKLRSCEIAKIVALQPCNLARVGEMMLRSRARDAHVGGEAGDEMARLARGDWWWVIGQERRSLSFIRPIAAAACLLWAVSVCAS